MSSPEDRAASEIIGAVIIFAFLVLAFSVYQGVVIPNQNRVIEFEHNQAAQDSVQDLRNAIRGTATAGTEASVSISLAARYPPRVLGINPGVSAGSVRTESLGSITLTNITASDSETADYFGTVTTTLGGFEAKALTYRPLYTHYTQAPVTSYENSVAYNHFSSGVNLSITDQVVVDGRKITLIALDGNVSEARQGSLTMDTQAVSTATNTVSVTNESGPINITIPTRLTAANWTDLLEDELDPTGAEKGKFVSAVKQTGPNQVSIILEPDVTYELRLAKVGVGTGSPEEPPKYIVDAEGDNTSVIENGTRKLVVEVRDRFNNPVSNVTVDATIVTAAKPGDTTEGVSPANASTDADGRATFIYSAPENVAEDQAADVEVTFDGDGTANETVTFDLKVINAGGDAVLGGSSDPASQAGDASGLIQLVDTFPLNATEPYDHVVLRLNNTANQSVNVTGFGLSFATQSDQSGTVEDGPNEVIDITVGADSRTISAIEGTAPVFFEEDPITLAGKGTLVDIELELDGTYVLAKNKESLIIEVTFYFEGGFSAQYSVHMFNA